MYSLERRTLAAHVEEIGRGVDGLANKSNVMSRTNSKAVTLGKLYFQGYYARVFGDLRVFLKKT